MAVSILCTGLADRAQSNRHLHFNLSKLCQCWREDALLLNAEFLHPI
jgi:hypothetical protein